MLWTPSSDAWRTSRLGCFVRWLGDRGLTFSDYQSLWRWSVNDLSGFWSAFREYADLGDAPELALASNSMPGASWFPGSEWNYAAEALRHDIGGPAVVSRSQTREGLELTMPQLREQVAAWRAGLTSGWAIERPPNSRSRLGYAK